MVSHISQFALPDLVCMPKHSLLHCILGYFIDGNYEFCVMSCLYKTNVTVAGAGYASLTIVHLVVAKSDTQLFIQLTEVI